MNIYHQMEPSNLLQFYGQSAIDLLAIPFIISFYIRDNSRSLLSTYRILFLFGSKKTFNNDDILHYERNRHLVYDNIA